MKTLDETTIFANYDKMEEYAYLPDQHPQGADAVVVELDRLREYGYNTFVTGLVDVLDIFVVGAIREYRKSHQQIQYHVVRHKNQHAGFAPNSKLDAESVTADADSLHEISYEEHLNRFQYVDQHLIDQYEAIVCYANPLNDGGVLYAYKRRD